MCILKTTCKPELQTQPNSEHPYGTEWIYCKKAGNFIHQSKLDCYKNNFTVEQINEKYNQYHHLL